MNLQGHVQNGVVVLDGDVSLPEGTAVSVTPCSGPVIVKEPGRLPVVRGGEPGSVHLTNERIQEILDQEDIDAIKRQWDASS